MNRRLIAALSGAILSAGSAMANDAASPEDPFLWLEEVESEQALDWARAQNERSEGRLQSHPLFEPLHQRYLEILNSEDRIAYPQLMGGEIYNFWRDADHVRGLWRTTSTEDYRNESPSWTALLDLDALAEAEGENWVWAGAACRYPDYDRCLIGLSRGGADANVRREFDLETRQFVDGGFELPESKSFISWRDRDSVFYAPAFTPEQMTSSQYPRQVYIWQRGTDRSEAELVFEGERSDVLVTALRFWDKDTPYDMILRLPSFFTREYHLYRDGETQRIAIPDDAELSGVLNGQLLVQLKSDWAREGTVLRQGALLAAPMESVLAGEPEFEVLFQPNARQAVAGVSTTENTVLVSILDNVNGQLVRFTRDESGWHQQRLDVPAMGTLSVVSADDRSDRFYFDHEGFLSPSTLFEADAMADTRQAIRNEPSWFDAEGMQVAQYEATSADGEKIPYFVVMPAGFEANGANPTLLGAYGGFEVPRTPFYSGLIGNGWLRQGGVYVLANIRGGGEFGPRWHQAALKENRQRAYDDLIAVAEDLIERDITSPEHLGIQGGSNGGLLVGAVMVQRPDLFNAVVCQVPLLDMKRYHLLLAGASWMAEYGNPEDPEEWAYISQYSPYQNVSAEADYPVAFFTTSTRDDRVHPGHARKMVARMLDQGHEVLYYENIEGGHGGAANLNQAAYLNALIHAYLHERLGAEAAAEG
ncbi:prolyl oligopeptidase family serine peptidase [Wenzhouxiangella marina]|uniref:Prolyl oligopeptidase n=1 Tax=Wenzhouxiangella marina TaxID=1579979 RepID=A0A0K0XXU4_9GAMM|nr:prolyl oligopeptidase family serine peptidase [Wenzhouxiangella marina]AKS42452.1 Prolyl oligopeptidase [Wenzhouxiangella marina]MBB6085773.1 prolyl oligopeptidase [Wenzhouxiangella marina]